MQGLIGAVARTADACEQAIRRLPAARREQLRRVRTNADGAEPAFGFLAAPDLAASDAAAPADDPLVVALHGHLLTDGGRVCHTGRDATATLRALYRQHGAAGFASLSGNHAFVLFDPAAGACVMRDAAGSKPLFRFDGGDACVFGTSALEVRRCAGGAIAGDADALHLFLRTGRPPVGERTLLAGVRAVPAGRPMQVPARDAARTHRPSLIGAADRPLDVDAAARQLLAHLLRVTAAQSDGAHVAAALSGGIDSSGILAGMRAGRDGRPQCYSFAHGRDDLPAAWNERPYAEQAATQCDADVTYVGLDAQALPAVFASTARAQDFPFGSPVVPAQAALFRIAADAGVQRLLSGHGPDILFGGGDSHLIARAADLFAGGRVVTALQLLAGARAFAGMSGPRLLRSALGQFAPRRWRARRTAAAPWCRSAWFDARIAAPASRAAGRDRLLQQIDDQLYDSVLPAALSAEECNARAAGIDNRSPYLVREMLDLAARLRPDAIVGRDGTTKPALRRALSGRVPDAILARKRAIGFAVPALQWLLELRDWVAARHASVMRLPYYDGPDADAIFAVLERRDGDAWQTAFQCWRWLSVAEWSEVNDVRFA